MTNIYPSSGPIRGLLKRIDTNEYRRTNRPFRRSLITGWRGNPSYGMCKWCQQPCERRRMWHSECAKAYLVAKGLVVHAGTSRPLIKYTGCEECGSKAMEIDHRVALSVAWERMLTGDRRWWAAWTIGNLRWLCRECHVTKTRDDRYVLRKLRKRRSIREQISISGWLKDEFDPFKTHQVAENLR